jgi:hypothetical protein
MDGNAVPTQEENDMTEATMTKQDKLLQAFKAGEQLTEAQMKARYGVANPRATVSSLRYKGYAIYANVHKDTKGRETTKYRIGNPKRAVVAAGYKAIAAGLVTITEDGKVVVNA